jgi:hypothetical protein
VAEHGTGVNHSIKPIVYRNDEKIHVTDSFMDDRAGIAMDGRR